MCATGANTQAYVQLLNSYSLGSDFHISLVLYWIMYWKKAGIEWFKICMVQGGTLILVLDISHQGKKVPISLATMFCTGSLLWSVAPTDLGQPLLEARMINPETCKLFFSLCHLCCGSVLAARRFEGALKYTEEKRMVYLCLCRNLKGRSGLMLMEHSLEYQKCSSFLYSCHEGSVSEQTYSYTELL